jgi:cellulose synthase/poly-beta-1,6-N-acetylglucosamine synthase-like glycosyltransferase
MGHPNLNHEQKGLGPVSWTPYGSARQPGQGRYDAFVKVSLVATVKDAEPHIEEFLASVRGQTRPPDEVVVVDGGSSDGTWEALQKAEGILALREPGANIARGRNVAIRAAAHEVIAVTDADCVLDAEWLARILEPIERGADVAAGFYRPVGGSLVQLCTAAVSLPEPDELRPGWMPSSRSLALRREAFEEAGGYPEWLEVGEDMYLNHRLVEHGARMELAPAAVAYWRLRPTLAATWRQYARYAEGDALAGMYPQRHAIRFATYAFGAFALVSGRRWARVPAVVGAIAYASRPTRRAFRRLPAGSAKRAAALAAVPAMMGFIDAAKMYGYLRGVARRGREA